MDTEELLHVFDSHTASSLRDTLCEFDDYSREEIYQVINEAIEELESFRNDWLAVAAELIDANKSKSGLPLIITNLDKLRIKRMPEISDNFSRSEFACKCGCGFDTVDAELVQVLEVVRFKYNSPVHITSGCRCDSHNKKVGGSDGSKHKLGIAADIVVEGVPAVEVYRFLTSIFKSGYGIGKYDEFTHIDIRVDKARW